MFQVMQLVLANQGALFLFTIHKFADVICFWAALDTSLAGNLIQAKMNFK